MFGLLAAGQAWIVPKRFTTMTRGMMNKLTMENTLFAVRNLSNHYAGEPLLQDVSFTLEEGEILCLLGPSGSGKTTLLRVLAGLEPLESGSIMFKGRDLRDVPPHLRKIVITSYSIHYTKLYEELCSRILAFNDQTKIIFITAFPSFEHAIEALRNGAHA